MAGKSTGYENHTATRDFNLYEHPFMRGMTVAEMMSACEHVTPEWVEAQIEVGNIVAGDSSCPAAETSAPTAPTAPETSHDTGGDSQAKTKRKPRSRKAG